MLLRRGLSTALLAGALALTSVFFLYPAHAKADQSTDNQLGKVLEEIGRDRLDLALTIG